MSQPTAASAVDKSERSGSPALVLLFAIPICAAAVASSVLPPEQSSRLTIGLSIVLAVVGMVALFAYALGLLQFSGQATRNDITKLIADTSSEAQLVTEGDTNIVYANESYMSLSGARDASGLRTIDRLFSGAPDVSEAVYRLAQAARENKAGVEELRMAPPLSGDGAVGWYRVRVRPLERLGQKRALLWSVADLTRERARHENIFQELRHAIDFLDHAPAGFFSSSPAGDIDYMNATLAGWLDHDLAQVGSGGLKLSNIVAGDASALIVAMAGRPGDVKTEQFDIDLRKRNGQGLPARLIHRVAFGQDGAPGPSRTLVLNRAPGEEPQEDLRAAQVRFARFFNQMPMAIATVAADGRALRANAAFAKLCPQALTSAAGGGAPAPACVAKRDAAALQAAIADAARGVSDIPPVDVDLDEEGTRSARFYATPAENDGEGAACTLFALDTTEQRALQQSFAQSQKMQAIGQLAGGVAHDFNNVLTAIIGFSDLLLASHRPTDPSFQDIMQIKQNAARAAGLVRQLLAFSRRQTLRPQVIELGDVLSDLRLLLRRLVGEKIDLDVKHGRDLWLVKADVNQFEQVIMNLVVNARDAMPEGGAIVLRTLNVNAADCAAYNEKSLVPADYVVIEISDTGTGIPDEVKEKIFEPFFTTKEVGKGTGLGLSMVYGIVKQTGGWVFCDSVVGKGTTFRIFLPRHIPEEKPEAVSAEPEAKAAVADLTGRGAVLLVEDEEAVRAFGARALASRGYTVFEAASGLEALDVVAEQRGKIDLIVSDVVMPEMDGPTMLGELRKRGVSCKIIFVSGYAEEAFARNLPAGEDFGFLAKPFTLKQLSETVKQHLG